MRQPGQDTPDQSPDPDGGLLGIPGGLEGLPGRPSRKKRKLVAGDDAISLPPRRKLGQLSQERELGQVDSELSDKQQQSYDDLEDAVSLERVKESYGDELDSPISTWRKIFPEIHGRMGEIGVQQLKKMTDNAEATN